jgi:dolichol-phosphate mannosyltransferase
MKTAVLIPVYNEAENIEPIIKNITDINAEYAIVIIDDDSKDGTREILDAIKNKFNINHYVRKNERGYGCALIYGFNQAKDFNIIITMDADLSHDPSDIPFLIDEINNGYDVVIGSRYIKGGKIHDWPLFRRITSKLTNLFVAIALRTNIKDNTSGYRAYSKATIEKLLGKINSTGYSVLEEILYWAKQENLKIKEVPIVFRDRKEGVTKVKIVQEAAQLFLLILELRKKGAKK